LSRKQAIEAFPTIHKDKLRGAIVYYDGIRPIFFKKKDSKTHSYCSKVYITIQGWM
jgi:hypothetical protein